jgi:hypothetical protein
MSILSAIRAMLLGMWKKVIERDPERFKRYYCCDIIPEIGILDEYGRIADMGTVNRLVQMFGQSPKRVPFGTVGDAKNIRDEEVACMLHEIWIEEKTLKGRINFTEFGRGRSVEAMKGEVVLRVSINENLDMRDVHEPEYIKNALYQMIFAKDKALYGSR